MTDGSARFAGLTCVRADAAGRVTSGLARDTDGGRRPVVSMAADDRWC